MATKSETFAACIRKCYPDLIIDHTQLHNTEGQFNEILFINHNLVFRFPRSTQVAETFAMMVEILNHIRPYLSLAVPNPIFTNFTSTQCIHAFIGYPKLSGQPLWPKTLEAIEDEILIDHLAEQLAHFLQELHNIPTNILRSNLPIHDGREEWVQLYADFQANLFQYMRADAIESVTLTFDKFLNDPHQFNYTPTLRHGDFGPSNILYDAASKTISGIIDFDSIGLGDPAVDVGAILSLGEDFFYRMCGTYPELANMRSRTEFYQSTYALQEALYGLRDNVPESFEAGIAAYR